MEYDLTKRLVDIQTRSCPHESGGDLSVSSKSNPENNSAKDLQQLPLWPDSSRGVPNAVLRSALFGAVKRGRRAFLQRRQVAAFGDITILQTGPRLDQADLDVWEQCLHLAKTCGVGQKIRFTAYSFLKSIDRSTGGKDIDWLKDAFARLSSSVVEITEGRRAYFGPMIHHGVRDDETGEYVIEINPKIVQLYGTDGWSSIELAQRKKLKGHPLAQWLHGFYTSHAEPYPLKVETLYKMCGSETKLLKSFRLSLREALKQLEQATGWKTKIDSNDLVVVKKTGTTSQNKYTLRKILSGVSK